MALTFANVIAMHQQLGSLPVSRSNRENAAEERERCRRLVEDYRDRIVRAMARVAAKKAGQMISPSDPFIRINGITLRQSDAVKFTEAICKSLEKIIEEIKRPKKSKPATGEFSSDEIEQAMILVESLSNPFEE